LFITVVEGKRRATMSELTKNTPHADEDFELIRDISNGRDERFADLVDRYAKRLYNFGLRMCGDARDAEDMVQDTFLNVYKYLNGFRGETKFKNWLYRIAASACLKKKRRSKYAPERELSLDEFLPREGEALPTDVPQWACEPLENLLNRELNKTLREKILSLPEKYRLVLVLRDIEGFSTEETARILGLSQSNIKVRLHRARLYLREQLKDYFGHDACKPLS
jgi:RNA polymerase sigma-70 factor (ECF subfamily)